MPIKDAALEDTTPVGDIPVLQSVTATSNLPPTQQSLNAAGFSLEQKRYLAEAVANLNIHLALGAGQSNQEAQEPMFWGTPIEDLCKEENAKYETHVLDLWDQIVEHNDANKIAEGITQFMFRHWGVFNVEPASPGYMCRLRLPSCMLRGDQMVALGDIAEHIAGGYAHITTRGSIQFREIKPNRILDLLAALYDFGMSCKGSGADSARNITASPLAGIDSQEVYDLHKYGIHLSHRIVNTRDLNGLPRKFNISFDNAGSISCLSDTNDVGFLAVKVTDNPQGIEPGVYCRLFLGGITGHEDFAKDTGMICLPEDTPEISEAILRVFLEHGDRTNRKKARFKYVLDAHGFDWVCEKIQEKLVEMGKDIKLMALSAEFEQPRPEVKRQAHIGVHSQAQQGLSYIGVALKMGRLSPEQLRLLGRVAMQYGNNDVRLTVWQNAIIANVPDDKVAEAVAAIEALDMPTSANAFAAGAVACTGKWACKLANAYTKEDGLAIVEHLQSRYTLDQPINIHLTGCPNSCAQHYISDIGLIGTSAEDGSEGYNVFVGGGTDQDRGLGRLLCGPIASRDICQLADKVIGNYLNTRNQDESFIQFTHRHSQQALQDILLADLT